MRRGPRLASVIGGAFVVWGLAVGLAALHDNSFLTHLSTGRLILAHGVPHADPYSFTVPGRSWVVESWLASALYGLVDRAGGGHGLVLLHAALTTTLAALVWHLTRAAGALFGRVLAAALALAVGTAMWSPRPLLMALVLLAVVVVTAESEVAAPWVLVPVMWVWVNVHGSFFVGVGYLLVRLVGRRLGRAPVGRLPRLTLWAAAGTLLGAANPFGPALLGHPLLALSEHANFVHVMEWRSPDFTDPVNAIYLGGALVTLLVLVVRRGTPEDALVAVVALAGAALAGRNVAVASLVTVPVTARALRGLGTVRGDERGPAPVAGAALVAGVAVTALAVGATRSPYDLSRYPVEAVTTLSGEGLLPGRVATPDVVGNYLEWRFGTAASVFFDDRVDMYPTSLVRDYETLLDGSRGWQAVLDRYHVQAVLWPSSDPLSGLVGESPHWRVIYHRGGWTAAVRNGA